MKNKNIIIKILMIAFCGIIISCDDFLDEDPRGILTPENFFLNEEESILALNELNRTVEGAGFNEFLGTDLGVSGRITLAASHLTGSYQFNSGSGPGWGGQYGSIRDANLLLSRIGNSSLPDDVIGRARAQALFFRADKYLFLTTRYGDVPFVVDEVMDIDQLSLLGQTDANVIISSVIEDLDEAISSGFLSTASWGDNDGRPTVWAARMLKAHAHIWLEEWAEARTELIEITTNSPHVLDDDFADKYREGNEIHSEIIFGKVFLANVSNNFNNTARPNLAAESLDARAAFAEVGVTNGSAPFTLRRSFANTFAMNDERRIYTVWDSHTLEDGTPVTFNWIYMPKINRTPTPISDPLLAEEEPRNNSSMPDRIFLLADAYLLLAEAEFMIGGSSAPALSAINTVRERANIPALTTLTLEDIQMERAWELVGEGYWGRKKDLVRWGILDSTILGLPAAEAAAGATAEAIQRAQNEADAFAAVPPNRFTEFPVPSVDLQLSQSVGGGLVQNPLWVD